MVACNRVPRLLWSVGNVFLFVRLLLFHFFSRRYLTHKHHLRGLCSSEVGWEPDAVLNCVTFLYHFLIRYLSLIVRNIYQPLYNICLVWAQSSIYNALISAKWILSIVFAQIHLLQFVGKMCWALSNNFALHFIRNCYD